MVLAHRSNDPRVGMQPSTETLSPIHQFIPLYRMQLFPVQGSSMWLFLKFGLILLK